MTDFTLSSSIGVGQISNQEGLHKLWFQIQSLIQKFTDEKNAYQHINSYPSIHLI